MWSTDYDRACSVEAPIARFTVGAGEALMITSAPPLAWGPSGREGPFVIPLEWGDLTDHVVTTLVGRSRLVVENPGVDFRTSDAALHVLAAAVTFGIEYGSGHFSIAVEPGRYRIRTEEHDEGPVGHFLVRHLDWVGGVCRCRGRTPERPVVGQTVVADLQHYQDVA